MNSPIITQYDLTYKEKSILSESLLKTNYRRQIGFWGLASIFVFVGSIGYAGIHEISTLLSPLSCIFILGYLTRPVNFEEIQLAYVRSVNAGERTRF